MNLTTFSDYSLRILIFLAVTEAPLVPARVIAERYGISAHHVAKASKWLVRRGYVSAVRGRGGGLRLARRPEDIIIGDVIRTSERGTGLVECMRAGGRCAIERSCGLAPVLDEARDAFFAALDRYSLADVAVDRRSIAKLLSIADRLSA